MSLEQRKALIGWVYELAKDSFPDCCLLFSNETLVLSEQLDYVSYHYDHVKIEMITEDDVNFTAVVFWEGEMVKKVHFSLINNKFI